ncbi:MAG: NAD(P)H-dependent glycerol-3-phosphate dehydrogenase [Pseudomonadales bacterium]|jgi:glycerol-3-phosphate dehydrogenase (NAD(P)+)|nr:NAD(P)H-dependent glycerol-3-phosphate dehydrogenase [Cellvibrionales bacterium]MBP8030129.1 NAD(P)H-dependent glycerol-3-phosphate dehydrogenase [Pseudomonadales bacterium]
MQTIQVVVIGGGSFGTAIANMMAENGHVSTLWLRDATRAGEIQASRENPLYLPGMKLHENLHVSADLAGSLRDAAVVFISVPSKAFRAMVQQIRPLLRPDAIVVSTAKGIETGDDHRGFWLMSDVLKQELPDHRIAVLSGPNLAGEIAERQLTGTVVASVDSAACQCVQDLLRGPYFRVYSNSDVYGVELGGVLKNSYAIACGMAAALGLGYNTISMLITRSLAEMGRFAAKLGADPLTFIGLAGVGDLIVTCTSPKSRNYRIGYALGQGKSLQQAIDEVGQVAEGINTVHLVKLKADELGVYMPLVSALNDIIFNGCSIADASAALMGSDNNSDVEYRANLLSAGSGQTT